MGALFRLPCVATDADTLSAWAGDHEAGTWVTAADGDAVPARRRARSPVAPRARQRGRGRGRDDDRAARPVAWAFPLHLAPSRSTWRSPPAFFSTRYCVPTDGLGSTFFYVVAGVFGAAHRELPQRLHPFLGRGAEGVGACARGRAARRCGNQIAWYDNIPVLSWLILRGKCRGCRSRSPCMYPLVELATCIIWVVLRLALRPDARRGARRGLLHPPARHPRHRRARLHHSR